MIKRMLSLALALTSAAVFAQPGLYFNFSAGYGWPAPQQNLEGITFLPNDTDPAGSTIIPLRNQNTSDSAAFKYQTNTYQGYANGVNINGVVGYMITNYIGVELGFGSLIGNKMKGSYTYDAPSVLGANANIKTETWSRGVSLSPSIRLIAAKPDAKVVPFGRFGLTIPFWGKTTHELNITSHDFVGTKMPANAVIRTETQSIFSLGFNGSVGVGYNITKWLRVYTEVIGNYLFVRTGGTEIKKYELTYKGSTEDMLPAYSTFSRKTKFVDELNENSNTVAYGKKRGSVGENTVDEDKPREELRRAANFSAFGLNVGLTFRIDNKLFKKKNRQPVPVHE